MQEPIEPMEDLQPIDHISINDGELSFENVDFKYDIKFLAMYLSVFLKGECICWPSGSGKVQYST